MGWFSRNKPVKPEILKAAEFHPTVRETILQFGGYYGSTYGSMYRNQPAVRAVVDFMGRNIAQLNGKVYERVSDTDRVEANDHPLAALMRNPNPVTTRYRHMFATVADMAIYDRAYWRKIRVGRSFSVVRISPAKIAVETDQNTGRVTYRTSQGIEIPRSQLIVFPGYSPDSFDEGVSPLETLRRVLQDETTVQQYRESLWRNAARQSGWVERPLEAPEWSDTARQRFRADIEAMMAGPRNAGRIGVLEEGMHWNQSAPMPPDSEYVGSRRLTYEEVAIVYFGPIGGRAWLEAATQAGTEENHRQIYQDVLGPWLRNLQDEIELQVLPEVQPIGRSNTYFEFNLAEKLKGSFETQATVLTTSVGVPVMAVNEGRARLNLPRIDDPAFDLPIQPLNVMYGGQAAVTVPTADNSTPELPSEMAALPAATKATPSQDLDRAAKDHEELLRKRAVSSAKGVVDRGRWDRELTADLYLLARKARVSDEFLAECARTAEAINQHTIDALETTADPRLAFEVAKSRTAQLALEQASLLVNFQIENPPKEAAR
jgi:HK97 family phage portal protein